MVQQWADLAPDRARVESERLRAAVHELHLLDRFPWGRDGIAKLHVRVDAGAAALRDLRSDVAQHPLRDRFGMLAGVAAGRRSIDSTRNRSDPVEFEVMADKLDTGLRGFPVGTCWTSRVDPEKGVARPARRPPSSNHTRGATISPALRPRATTGFPHARRRCLTSRPKMSHRPLLASCARRPQ